MAESTLASRRKFTMAKAQENLYALNVANMVCDVDTQKVGTVYNPYTSKGVVTDSAFSANTYNVGTYSQDADSLEINRRAVWSEIVGEYHLMSSEINLMQNRGVEGGKGISQVIDGYVLSLPKTTAGVTTLDDASFGGSADTAITVGSGAADGIDDIINVGTQEVELGNAYGKKFMVVSSYESKDLKGFLQSTGNMVMDEVLRNGFAVGKSVNKVGTTFSGVDVFQSNNITQTVVLGIATNPTDGDTITIAGVEITFVATLSGGDAEVHICSTVDNTAAELTEFLNAPATAVAEATDAGIAAASQEDIATLSALGLVAVATAGSDIVTITTKGVVRVSETLTDATDTFATPERYLVFGEYGFINLYQPSQGMSYEEKPVSGTDGKEVFLRQFYNATIWTRNLVRGLAIRVN